MSISKYSKRIDFRINGKRMTVVIGEQFLKQFELEKVREEACLPVWEFKNKPRITDSSFVKKLLIEALNIRIENRKKLK